METEMMMSFKICPECNGIVLFLPNGERACGCLVEPRQNESDAEKSNRHAKAGLYLLLIKKNQINNEIEMTRNNKKLAENNARLGMPHQDITPSPKSPENLSTNLALEELLVNFEEIKGRINHMFGLKAFLIASNPDRGEVYA